MVIVHPKGRVGFLTRFILMCSHNLNIKELLVSAQATAPFSAQATTTTVKLELIIQINSSNSDLVSLRKSIASLAKLLNWSVYSTKYFNV